MTADEIKEYFREHLPELGDSMPFLLFLDEMELVDEIDECISILKQQRKDAKNEIARQLCEVVYPEVKATTNIQYFASVLYWLAESYISASDVLHPLNIKSSAIKQYIHPLVVSHCETCEARLTIDTRSKLQQLTQRRKSGQLYTSDRLCSDCIAKRTTAQLEVGRKATAELTHRLEQLRTMPYRDYLQTDEWKEKRKAAMKRANFRCQVCNGSGQLNTHHRTYERRGNELPKDLIVLCQPCHEIFHQQGKLAKEQG